MTLGLLLVLAAVLGRLVRRIGLPAIPVYMLVGLAASPFVELIPIHLPYEEIHLLATVGLVMLLFQLGLEFDTAAFAQDAKKLILAGVTYILINFGAGLALGFALGWGGPEALVIAGITGVSSSAIVTKLMADLGKMKSPETPLILGIVVIEDVFLAVYLSVLNAVVSPTGSIWVTLLRLGVSIGFLVLLFAVARRGSRFISRIVGARAAEMFTVGLVGVTLLIAGIAEEVGVSDAIGAFMVGLIVAGTHARHRAEETTAPLRDTFAAVFFIGFGLSLDPSSFGGVLVPVSIAVGVTLVANLGSGLLAARIQRHSVFVGLEIGLMLLSRGEFALILATISAAAGLDPRITAFAGLYVLILAVVGPLLATYVPRLWAGRQRIGTASPNAKTSA